jgi:hypothetical protein
MPHPFFGAKDVCYIEKKVAKKKPFLARRACSDYHYIIKMNRGRRPNKTSEAAS